MYCLLYHCPDHCGVGRDVCRLTVWTVLSSSPLLSTTSSGHSDRALSALTTVRGYQAGDSLTNTGLNTQYLQNCESIFVCFLFQDQQNFSTKHGLIGLVQLATLHNWELFVGILS